MKVLFFAQSREAAGCAEYDLAVSKPVTVPEFWDLLIRDFPALEPFRKATRFARRELYLQAKEVLHPDDEIAIIPPVSGG